MRSRSGQLAALSLLVLQGCAALESLPDLATHGESEARLSHRELPAPSDVRARSGVFRAIPLVWDPAPQGDVAGYRIERAEAREGPFEEIVQLSGRGQLLYLDEGDTAHLSDAATRFYRVRSLDAEGRPGREASPVVVATTAPAPAAPHGLRAYSQHPRQVPLAWQASEDPLTRGYVVERSPARIGPYRRIAETHSRQQTAYLDHALGDLAVFYYRVSARNREGALGAPSPAVRAITKAEPLPPLGLRLTSQRLGANTLEWQPNVERDLSAYRLIRVGVEGTPETVATVPADVTTLLDSDVSSGEALSYQAVALDRDGLESRPSAPLGVRAQDYGLRVEATAKGVSLRWRPRWDEGYRGARILRKRGLFERRQRRVQSDHFLDEEVEAGGRYHYVVTLEFPDGSPGPPSRPVEIFVGVSPLP